MTTKVADRVVLDTNVLLSATDMGRAEFDRARATLDEWPARGTTLYTTGQILREYLSVTTRPVARNGLGLPRADAVGNVIAFRDRLHLLAETDKVADRMLDLLTTTTCAGKQVHDANIVATMLTHGVHTLVTVNVDDFTRFGHAIDVVPL